MHRPPRPDDEAHRLLDRLTAPEAPIEAPAWDEEAAPEPSPRRRWPWLFVPALAAAAGAMLLILPEQDPERGLRGQVDEAWVDVDLRLVAIQDGQARRAVDGDTLYVGDQVLLRVGSTPVGVLSLWVETPTGAEPLATVTAGPDPTEVEVGDQLLAWSFEGPGRYEVVASARGPGSCPESACARIGLAIEAREEEHDMPGGQE